MNGIIVKITLNIIIGIQVCAMCCKTSKNSREVVEKRKEEERKKKEKVKI